MTTTRIPLAIALLALASVLAGCGGARANEPPTPSQIALATVEAPATSTLRPTEAPTLTPRATPFPTWTPSPSPTSTRTPAPTVTPTPLNPLSVEHMRGQEYPGSDIVIEQKLAPGSNYQRYLTSYRSEGLKIYALLTVPNGTPPATGWPVIVFNHGYIPPEQYRTTERYVAYVDGFARNGYIVFRPDYRGHGSSEGNASGGYGSPDYTVDVLNAVSSVQRYPAADPDRIGMWGHSMGGHITLRSMVTRGDIKAGVIWAGVVASYPELMSRWRRPVPTSVPTRARRWRDDFVQQYGSPETNPGFWTSISPNSYLADLSGPLQLHHGTADESVPTEFSQNLYRQAQDANLPVPVEYYEYPGDNHNLSRSFSTAMQRSVVFFDKYLKNVRASTG